VAKPVAKTTSSAMLRRYISTIPASPVPSAARSAKPAIRCATMSILCTSAITPPPFEGDSADFAALFYVFISVRPGRGDC